jgi:hypothetical protein
VWLTFFLFVSDFCHRTSALLSSSLKKHKSVGAQLSACLIFSAQILAVEKKLAFASAQFLAED